jgi:RNA polymerase alpha subunit
VTDRAWVASLPDETPVEDLPLPRGTLNRLREAGILTLGDLRGTSDRELLRLRRFGPYSLAEVRALVPAPAEPGPRALPLGSTVSTAGRVFRLGAVYAAAPHVRPYESGRLLPLRLVGHGPAYPWPEGRVEAELVPPAARLRTTRRWLSGRVWAKWAGEEVGR